MLPPVADLPLPLAELPPEIQRFCDPSGPAAGRMMAAKGLIPVQGPTLVCLLLQLAAGEDREAAKTASDSLDKLPQGIVQQAAQSPLDPAFLHALASRLKRDQELLELLVANRSVADATIDRIAQTASEQLCERIAVDEQRLLKAPRIIESLYKNPEMRMSTADRLIDLAVRHEIVLEGIPAFQEHADAIRGQLIPEATDAALPSDDIFKQTLAEDADDPEAVERDLVDGSETLKEQYKPLSLLIADLTKAEKIRLAMVGSAAARSLLIRDTNKQVSFAAVSSPRATEQEAVAFSKSKEVSEDVLRYIGRKREWLKNYEIKRGLVFNPKTPVGLALKFLSHMREHDLKQLSRSRNVAAALKSAARHRLEKKEKR